ncbi:MAG TPA: hypothetical protein VGD80_01470, partial [Kofleriaceae bacterium]
MEAISNEATVKVECPGELLERFAEALAGVEGVFEQREVTALALAAGRRSQRTDGGAARVACGITGERNTRAGVQRRTGLRRATAAALPGRDGRGASPRPSRSTLERMGKRIGDAIQGIVTEVEPAIRRTEPTLRAGRSISIGFDRTTVPMAEPA